MLETKKDFSKILKDAQQLGYAESDPSFDIDGIDTLRINLQFSLRYHSMQCVI